MLKFLITSIFLAQTGLFAMATEIRTPLKFHIKDPNSKVRLNPLKNKFPNFMNPAVGVWSQYPNTAIGSSYTQSTILTVQAGYHVWFYAASTSGGGDFIELGQNCSGANLGESQYCLIQLKFQPTVSGLHSLEYTFPVDICTTTTCWSDTMVVDVEGYSEPPCITCAAKKLGSDINVDEQSISESIPLVGSDFKLFYSSLNSSDYVVSNPLGAVAQFNPHGLTISPVHYFSLTKSIVFFGTGTSRYVDKKLNASNQYEVVSDDGSEVYLFSSTGIHQSTLYGLTGQTKYSISYNLSGKVSQIDDAFGNSTIFNYDINGDLASIQAPRGQTTNITVWSGTKLIKYVENPNGEKYELTYKTGTTLLETFKKPAGNVSTFTFDANGRLTKDLGHGGDFWELVKSTTGPNYPISVSSKLGRTTSVVTSRTGFDYSRTETLPTGALRTYTQGYSPNDLVTAFNGRTSTVVMSNDERFGDAFHRVSLEKTKMGTVESSTAYAQSVSYGVGITPGFFNFQSITKTATTSGRVTTSVYVASTKKTTTTTDEGATSSVTIDNYERPTELQTGLDTPWTFTYGTYGRLDEVVQGTHKKATYTYNSNGYVSKVKNTRNEETQYTYDLSGRVSQVTLPDSRVINYSYDSNGNISGITPPSKPQHVFSQNNLDLLASYQPPSMGVGIAKNTTYTYNDDKQLTQISRPDGQNVVYSYDSTKGRLTQITTPTGNFLYAYDTTTQKLSSLSSPDGVYNLLSYYGDVISGSQMKRTSDNLLFGETKFNYDADHRISSRFVRGNPTTPTSTISYTYNDDNKPTAVGDLSLSYSYPSGRLSGTTIGRISDNYTYDSYGDLITYTAVDTPTGGSPTTLYTYTLTRDLEGRISQKVETIQGVTATYEYFYDTAGRLTSVKKNGTVTDSFSYDDNGNRTSGAIDGVAFTATYDDQDRILTYGSRTYTHNNNGDLTRIQWNVTDRTDIVHDVMGNVKQVTLPSGTVLQYTWDGYNRWIGKTSGGTFVVGNLYENQYRISASLNALAQYVREYIYATKVNVPDYLIMSGVKYRFITDHLGSPRLLVRTDTGAISQRMDYNTLGLVTADSNPTIHPFGFAGGLWDAQTMTVRFGARTYDPRSTGRWTTKDPIRFKGGDVNLYGYVLNDPINFIDPEGLAAHPLPKDFRTPYSECAECMVQPQKCIDPKLDPKESPELNPHNWFGPTNPGPRTPRPYNPGDEGRPPQVS